MNLENAITQTSHSINHDSKGGVKSFCLANKFGFRQLRTSSFKN